MIWQASYTPFGQATVNADPDNNGIFYVQNFRLPGQYYDAETGLHYNYQRDYNPRSGRYLTGDPLGFGGGSLNLYAHCGGDPFNWADPSGERTSPSAMIIAGAGVAMKNLRYFFVLGSVQAAAANAMLRIMPKSEFNYWMAMKAVMVLFKHIIFSAITGRHTNEEHSGDDSEGEGRDEGMVQLTMYIRIRNTDLPEGLMLTGR